jgi:hypothetical protein
MTPKLIFYIFLFIGLSAQAQWMEKFDYNDWNSQSDWLGNLQSFALENGKLRSDNDIANSEFYVSRSITIEPEMVWEFWVNLKFNTSSANYLDVYLFSDSINLKGQKNGYFVRIGNTKDEIVLYKSNAGAAPIVMIDGRDNITVGSNNIIKVKVERNAFGRWNLYSDLDVTGTYFQEGIVYDSSFTNAKYFGLLVKQSTFSFFKRHYIDNIYVGAPILDTVSPSLVKLNVATDSSIQLLFSEPILVNQIVDSCFSIIGMKFRSSSINKDSVLLVFDQKIKTYMPYNLTIRNLQDLNTNLFNDTIVTFVYSNPATPLFKQLLITEIMADPDPAVNLPSAEYIEILNRHNVPIQLKGSTLSDPSKTVVFPDFIIQPNEFVIICDNVHVSELSGYGRIAGVVGFPSLNNTSDEIVIRSKTGEIIHKVVYSDKWYKDEIKRTGGWSLEMIDTSALCFEEGNWQASNHSDGGSPGKLNSINRENRDTIAPAILSFTVAKEGIVRMLLSEPIDSNVAVVKSNYKITGFNILSITYSVNTIVLFAEDSFEIGPNYSIEIQGFKDCAGNITKPVIFSFIIPDTAVYGDLIINEILFNPKGDGVDYVELFNNSNKFIDLIELSLCNKDTGASFKNIKALANSTFVIAPKSYVLFTTSSNEIWQQYPISDSNAFFVLNALPTLNNDKGDIWLITKNRNIVDGMLYDEHMHHGLLKDVDGVSLERINVGKPALNRNNWTSASSNVYYGTPGLKNSQSTNEIDEMSKEVQLSSGVISPDGDGYQDILLIHIADRYAGLNLNMMILDISGRKVRDLAQNALLGVNDTYQWDGANNKGIRLSLGVYIIYVEIWGGDSEAFRIKVPVTLGGIFDSH